MTETKMSKGSKIAVTILLIVGFIVISAIVLDSGGSQTFVGLIALGLFYGVRLMFKSEPKDDSAAMQLNKDKLETKDHQLR